jgi:hypothetical protein
MSLSYNGLLILHKEASTTTRTASYFRNILEATVPEIFPINIDDNDDNDGFSTIPTKSTSKPTTKPSENINDIMRNLDSKLHTDKFTNGNVWVVIRGRGGPRAMGVYNEYYSGIRGAKYLVEGISGNHCRAFDNENDAFEYLEMHYPGVDDYEKIRLFHACVPDTATNLHPLYSEHSGKVFHKYGAEEFTCTELDDEELMTLRRKATKFVTGYPNGKPNNRSHFFRMMELFRNTLHEHYHGRTNFNYGYPGATNDEDEAHPGATTKADYEDETDDDGNDDNLIFEDYPTTQDDDVAQPEVTDDHEMDLDQANHQATSPSSTKKRKVHEEHSKATDESNCQKPTETNPMTWHSPNPSNNHQLTYVCVSIPHIACLYDVKLYFDGFKDGFGFWFDKQTQLCVFTPFPQCMSVIVGCPTHMNDDFRYFVAHNKFFGKYKVFSTIVYNHNEYHISAPDKHLESIAKHPLIQYVKNANHPANDHLLHHKLANAAGPQEVYEYFLSNLMADCIDENSKELSDDWCFPLKSTGFDPRPFERDIVPPGKTPTMIFGTDESF